MYTALTRSVNQLPQKALLYYIRYIRTLFQCSDVGGGYRNDIQLVKGHTTTIPEILLEIGIT